MIGMGVGCVCMGVAMLVGMIMVMVMVVVMAAVFQDYFRIERQSWCCHLA